ncbi:hypothetical protein [Lysobacter silvisoli]|uniref:Uncharacterized protein n=1 Tax=Lysobacter silvisoli TaxID=2293254 RepID=A0A371JY78_9GAMM|nr:hypothetical protein [Lysobacter silvisoli]RDZ26572.1 hypothetical protein DX914_16430 [Lysobacter silvisoli]
MSDSLLDCQGSTIRAGDSVRVIGVPDLSGMAQPYREQSLRVFQHIVGSYKTVAEIDEDGQVWLRFGIRKGPLSGWHSLGIELHLLRLRRSRTVSAN